MAQQNDTNPPPMPTNTDTNTHTSFNGSFNGQIYSTKNQLQSLLKDKYTASPRGNTKLDPSYWAEIRNFSHWVIRKGLVDNNGYIGSRSNVIRYYNEYVSKALKGRNHRTIFRVRFAIQKWIEVVETPSGVTSWRLHDDLNIKNVESGAMTSTNDDDEISRQETLRANGTIINRRIHHNDAHDGIKDYIMEDEDILKQIDYAMRYWTRRTGVPNHILTQF